MKIFIENFFKVKENKTTLSRELYSGLISFFGIAYIISVYPSSLTPVDVPFSASVTSTILVCFFSSLTMGLYAKNPLIMGPALGVNFFFTHTMILKLGLSYGEALGATFWSGVLFLILSILKIRELVFNLIPLSIKQALTASIGAMIALIGFEQAKIFTFSSSSWISFQSPSLIWFIFCFTLTLFIVLKKIRGSFFLSIILITLLSIPFGRWFESPLEFNGVLSLPNFSLIGKIDFINSLRWSVLPSLLSLAFVDLSESFGTLMSLLEPFKLTENNKPRRLKESLITDALGTIYSSLLGISSATTYVESAAGLQAGGRTGLSPLCTAFLFLPFLFLSPLLSLIPPMATAPVLIIVGLSIMTPIKDISWDKLNIAFPAFLMIMIIPMTFSITKGLVFGCMSYILTHWILKHGNK